MTGSAFSNNQAVGAAENANGSYYGMGGAVENNAGFNADSPSTANFTGCLFVNNVATAVSGGSGQGGALDNQGFGAVMTLADCTLTRTRRSAALTAPMARELAGPFSTTSEAP